MLIQSPQKLAVRERERETSMARGGKRTEKEKKNENEADIHFLNFLVHSRRKTGTK